MTTQKIQVLTVPALQGVRYRHYTPMVASATSQTGQFKDIGVGFGSFFREVQATFSRKQVKVSDRYDTAIEAAHEAVMDAMRDKASKLGCDAVIDFKIVDIEFMQDNTIFILGHGTPIKFMRSKKAD